MTTITLLDPVEHYQKQASLAQAEQAREDRLAYSRHWMRDRQCDCTRCARHIERTFGVAS